MANAHDLRACQQCLADVELEKSKFERKQRKIYSVSTMINSLRNIPIEMVYI